jgi:hypothetical protein
MKHLLVLLLVLVALLWGLPAAMASPLEPLVEQRYCGAPKRNAAGVIIRRADVRTAFRKAHHCPATGLPTGPCPGWQMDHIIPLVCGGCDAVSNIQWLPLALKITPLTGKDRFERKIYCKINPAK